jgi:hypothetical protein
MEAPIKSISVLSLRPQGKIFAVPGYRPVSPGKISRVADGTGAAAGGRRSSRHSGVLPSREGRATIRKPGSPRPLVPPLNRAR